MSECVQNLSLCPIVSETRNGRFLCQVVSAKGDRRAVAGGGSRCAGLAGDVDGLLRGNF